MAEEDAMKKRIEGLRLDRIHVPLRALSTKILDIGTTSLRVRAISDLPTLSGLAGEDALIADAGDLAS